MFYTTTLVFLRGSIALFLLKICVKKTHKMVIYVTMSIVIVYTIFYFFLAIFQCNPPSFFWQKYLGAKGVCLDSHVFPGATYGHSIVSALADWTLALLPIWVIWDLQMNLRTKASVGVLLGLGMMYVFPSVAPKHLLMSKIVLGSQP